MSRSIHTTRRMLAELCRSDFGDRKERAKLIRAARGALRKKRHIKERVTEERHRTEPPLGGMSPDAIPIEIADAASHVHYPLSIEDVRALLHRLPQAATEGISKIRLCLGKEYIDSGSESDADRDPLTGRIGSERLPGIYSGRILGTYAPWSGEIEVYAMVYDLTALDRLALPREATLVWLRLSMAQTLVHEIAHHHDRLVRTGRGRWLAGRFGPSESYAERMEHDWTQNIVVPWMEEQFPSEIRLLLAWFERFGFVSLPLGFFAGDPRRTARDGSRSSHWFPSEHALESFVETCTKEKVSSPTRECAMDFAWNMHFADQYELCLEIIERILVENQLWAPALILKADTLIHLERYPEAWNLLSDLRRRIPTESDVWHNQAQILMIQKNWHALLTLCHDWEQAVDRTTNPDGVISDYRAVACCGLERWDEMTQWIEAQIPEDSSAALERARRFTFRRAGKRMPA